MTHTKTIYAHLYCHTKRQPIAFFQNKLKDTKIITNGCFDIAININHQVIQQINGIVFKITTCNCNSYVKVEGIWLPNIYESTYTFLQNFLIIKCFVCSEFRDTSVLYTFFFILLVFEHFQSVMTCFGTFRKLFNSR